MRPLAAGLRDGLLKAGVPEEKVGYIVRKWVKAAVADFQQAHQDTPEDAADHEHHHGWHHHHHHEHRHHEHAHEEYVAEEYTVHDIGDRKNARERGVEQKEIADRFWRDGNMSGSIDYQIAEGDLVLLTAFGAGFHWSAALLQY